MAMVAFVAITVGLGGMAFATGPETGNGTPGTTITVTPSDGLVTGGITTVVTVTGTGFRAPDPANNVGPVTVSECNASAGPSGFCNDILTVVADQSGNFSTTISVSDHVVQNQCASTGDCVVKANQFSSLGFKTAVHHLSFGPTPVVASKTADASPVLPGAGDGYSVKLLNGSTTAATLASVTDTLPAGFGYVAGSTTGGISANPTVSGRQLTWAGPFTVAAGGSLQFHFNVTVSSTPGVYFNTVTASSASASVTPATDVAPIAVVTIVPVPVVPLAGVPIALALLAIAGVVWAQRRRVKTAIPKS